MNLKKKIGIPLIVLGVSIILVFLIISAFVFQKNLILPKVEASPQTCEVGDNVKINGWLQLTPQACAADMPCTPDMAGTLIVCTTGCPTCDHDSSRCFIICDWNGSWNCVEDLQ